MGECTEQSHLVVIDQQKYWRDLSVRTLTEAGYAVSAWESYNYPPSDELEHMKSPDLVIVGCATLGPEEHELIGRILSHGQHVLVLATALPWKVMRKLFLAGADDVMDKPYNPEQLVAVVRQALESAALRDEYRAREWERQYE